MKQHAFAVIAPVIPGKLEELRSLLNVIHGDVEKNSLVRFCDLGTIHFARFVIIETQKETYPVQLSFSSNHDESEEEHISELIRVAGEGLKKIYSCCEGFDGDFKAYFLKYKVPAKAYYIGHRGRGLAQIRDESRLQKAIVDFLDSENRNGSLNKMNPSEIKNKIGAYIKSNPDFEFAVKYKGLDGPDQFFRERGLLILLLLAIGGFLFLVGKGIHSLAFPAWLVVLIILLATLTVIFFVLKRKLNRLEETDVSVVDLVDSDKVNSLMRAENFVVQNQLTHIVEVKPGSFRRRTLKFVLGAINLLAKILFNRGTLGGIPSIHFARWVMIDSDKRLLFFSNFDGSWENYLGDFVDKASVGLTGVWSNSKNFPKTENLVSKGATDEQHFKEWARQHQIPTQVWYTAYKGLSVENINNNSLIRRGLFRKMSEAKAQQWLKRINNG
ncbi:MAG TPA: hypothetical protein VE978_16050 [Chitinophagales bacterium]|nr:hypothetical protein [Chitinophagales bacterium]